MKRLAVLHVYVLIEVIVELVCLVDVFGVYLVSLLNDKYKRVIDFFGILMNTSSF